MSEHNDDFAVRSNDGSDRRSSSRSRKSSVSNTSTARRSAKPKKRNPQQRVVVHAVAPHTAEFPLLVPCHDVLLDPVPNCALLDACLVDNKFLVTAHANGVRVFTSHQSRPHDDHGGRSSGGGGGVPPQWTLQRYRSDPTLQYSYLCSAFAPQCTSIASTLQHGSANSGSRAAHKRDPINGRFGKYFAVASGNDGVSSLEQAGGQYCVSVMSTSSNFIVTMPFVHRVTALCVTVVHEPPRDTGGGGGGPQPVVLACDETNQLFLIDILREQVVHVPSDFIASVASTAGATSFVSSVHVAAACPQPCSECASLHHAALHGSAEVSSSSPLTLLAVYVVLTSSSSSDALAPSAVATNIDSASAGLTHHQVVLLHLGVPLQQRRLPMVAAAAPSAEVFRASVIEAESFTNAPSTIPFLNNLAQQTSSSLALCLVASPALGLRNTLVVARPRLRMLPLHACAAAPIASQQQVRVYREDDMSNGLGARKDNEYFTRLDGVSASAMMLDGSGRFTLDDESAYPFGPSWDTVCVGTTNDGSCLLLGLNKPETCTQDADETHDWMEGDGHDGKVQGGPAAVNDRRVNHQLEAWLNDVVDEDTTTSSSSSSTSSSAAGSDSRQQRAELRNSKKSREKKRTSIGKTAAKTLGTRLVAADRYDPMECSVLWHIFCPVQDMRSRNAQGVPRIPLKTFLSVQQLTITVTLLLSDGCIVSVVLPLRQLFTPSHANNQTVGHPVSCDEVAHQKQRIKPHGKKGSLMYLVTSPFHNMVIPNTVKHLTGTSTGGTSTSSVPVAPSSGGQQPAAPPRSITRALISTLFDFTSNVAASAPQQPKPMPQRSAHPAQARNDGSPEVASDPTHPSESPQSFSHHHSPEAKAPASVAHTVSSPEVPSTEQSGNAAPPGARRFQAEVVVPMARPTKKKAHRIMVLDMPAPSAAQQLLAPPADLLPVGTISVEPDTRETNHLGSSSISYAAQRVSETRSLIELERLENCADFERVRLLSELQRLFDESLLDELGRRNQLQYTECSHFASIFQQYNTAHEKFLRQIAAAKKTKRTAASSESLAPTATIALTTAFSPSPATESVTNTVQRPSTRVTFDFHFVSDAVHKGSRCSARFMSVYRSLSSTSSAAVPGPKGSAASAISKRPSIVAPSSEAATELPPLHPALLLSTEYFSSVLAPLMDRDRCAFELEDLRAAHREQLTKLIEHEVIVVFENQRKVPNSGNARDCSDAVWEAFARLPYQDASGAPATLHGASVVVGVQPPPSALKDGASEWMESAWQVMTGHTGWWKSTITASASMIRVSESRRNTATDDDDEDDEDGEGGTNYVSSAAAVDAGAAVAGGWWYAPRWPTTEPGDGEHWSRASDDGPSKWTVRRRALWRTRIDHTVVRKMEALRKKMSREEEVLRRELHL